MKTLTARHIRRWFPKRKKTANKGQCGRVYIIAGSRGMVGAGVLASWGAIRSGAGLVRLATVSSQQKIAARRSPLEVTTQGLPQGRNGKLSSSAIRLINKTIRQFKPHVVAVGPGLGQSPSIRKILGAIWKSNCGLVIDADGLNSLSKMKMKKKRKAAVILTPHPGEMSRLIGMSIKAVQKKRNQVVKKAARKYNSVCLLKGKGSLISDGNHIFKNPTGNEGLATGGTGDVLTGIIASVLGQMPNRKVDDAFKAASIGAYLHGKAGDRAARVTGKIALIASDLVEHLPFIIRHI